MPREIFGPSYQFLPEQETLTIDEVLRVTGILVKLGVRKVRLTGGEPLLRQDLVDIVRAISRMPGVEDIALTTNGSLLTLGRAKALADAGLRRITISLDALQDEVFQTINDVGFPVERVLRAIEAAQTAGLHPVKINMVVQRGRNESEILPMANHFRGTGAILRFIEYMDVGNSNGWKLQDVISAKEIHDTIATEHSLVALEAAVPGEVATRFAYEDGQGEIGIIHSVTKPFCSGCTRLRLTAGGELFTCLFGAKGLPLRQRLRNGTTDAELEQLLASLWRRRADRYSELRSSKTTNHPRVEMSRIGG